MTSEQFNEKFPELKGQGLHRQDAHCLEREDGVFLREDIENNCLSKQRVREAIKRLSSVNPHSAQWLIAELGL